MIGKPEPASPVHRRTRRPHQPSPAWIRGGTRHSRSQTATPILASLFAAPRLLLAVLAGAIALALMDTAAQAAGGLEPRPAGPGLGQYLGRWNYDQPDRASMRNVAVIQCPANDTSCAGPAPSGGPLLVPQVGDIVFAKDADGGVVGRTDQGCTWHFAVRPASLELAPPSQYCFNQVIGSGYTLTRWSVTVRGSHERETIAAVSHQPNADYDFVLNNGSRTQVAEQGSPGVVRGFAGTWLYAPADPQTLVNIVISHETGPDGMQVRLFPQTGIVGFTKGRNGIVVAHTGDGCRWTLVVRGNTAQLAPASQSCPLPGTTVTLTHWAIASDGLRQASVLAGVEESGAKTSNFLLNVGELSRQ
jgi:hypothetical protein